ncbi:MAG: hypothetical protein AMXMBFR33_38040 [Candidatus Xenobia bacterium]
MTPPRLIAGILISFVLVQISFVTMASRSFEGPDQPGYYKMGLEHDRLMRPQRQGWHVQHNLPQRLQAGQSFHLEARAVDANQQPVQGNLTVRVGRPATRSQDRQLTLPADWQPAPGWWDVVFELDGQRLDKVRVAAR